MTNKAIPSYLIPHDPNEPDLEPLEYALRLLVAGGQDYAAFRIAAEHVVEHGDTPEKINPMAMQWLTQAFKKILDDEPFDKAFGRKRLVGRGKNYITSTKVQAYLEICKRQGVSKARAFDMASDKYGCDRRQVQRMPINEVRLDCSSMNADLLTTIAEKGVHVMFIGGYNSKKKT